MLVRSDRLKRSTWLVQIRSTFGAPWIVALSAPVSFAGLYRRSPSGLLPYCLTSVA
jgi:hypothetical protein